MDSLSERERIRTVYRQYDTSLSEQHKRDPSNPGNVEIRDHWLARTRLLLERAGVPPSSRLHVLDLGCGDGQFLRWLADQGCRARNLVGVDLLLSRVTVAHNRLPASAILQADGCYLPFQDAIFHVVSLITVFSSVLDQEIRRLIGREVMRVLAPGGVVLCYDIRWANPSNPNVIAISLRELERIFPRAEHQFESITLIPPLARRLGPSTRALYPLLAGVPVLRSHVIGTARKTEAV